MFHEQIQEAQMEFQTFRVKNRYRRHRDAGIMRIDRKAVTIGYYVRKNLENVKNIKNHTPTNTKRT